MPSEIARRLRTYPNGTDLDREAADRLDLLTDLIERAVFNYQIPDPLCRDMRAALKE